MSISPAAQEFIDYELSSWKYQNENYTPSKCLPYILGEQPLPAGSKIHIKSGCVLRENQIGKGMGSAHGGPWQSAKPADEHFLGEPGTIKDLQNPRRNLLPVMKPPIHCTTHTAVCLTL